MAQMNISNTLWNDTSTGEIAYVEQLKDRLLKDYIAGSPDFNNTDRERIPADIKANAGVFQEKLNEFFLKHWVDFQRFLLDEGVDPTTIDSWYEVKRFLDGLDDDTSMWLKNKLTSIDTAIAGIDQDGIGIFDISAYHNTGGTYAEYATLSDASAAVPTEARKSGMTIRYIDSTTHKYEQYRYLLEYANTTAGNNDFVNVDNWTKDDSDGVFDVSAKYPTSGVEGGNTYTLEGALAVLNANLSASKKKGGMSIKFIQSSDNKYVKFFCTADEFTTDVTKWQGVDDKPVAGSDNLVKSGGVKSKINEINKCIFTHLPIKNVFNPETIASDKQVNYVYGSLGDIEGVFASDFIPVIPGQYVMECGGSDTKGNTTASAYCWYNKNQVKEVSGASSWVQNSCKQVPENCYYLRISNPLTYVNTLMLLISDELITEVPSYVSYEEVIDGDNRITLLENRTTVVEGTAAGLVNEINNKPVYNKLDLTALTANSQVNYIYGIISSATGMSLSDFIPVTYGQKIMFWGIAGNCCYYWYKSDKAERKGYRGEQNTSQTTIIQCQHEDIAYIRVSGIMNASSMVLVCDSNFEAPLSYFAYNTYIGGESKINDNTSRIESVEGNVDRIESDLYIAKVYNVFNPNTYTDYSYVNYSNGNVSTTTNQVFVSDFIPVKPNQYVMACGGVTMPFGSNLSGFAWYGKDKVFKTRGEITWEQGTIKQVPNNCYYLRVNNQTSYVSTFMLLISDKTFNLPNNYIEYGDFIGGEPKIANLDNLEYKVNKEINRNALYGKTFVSIGDSLSNGHIWEGFLEQLSGATMINSYSKGGSMSIPSYAGDSTEDRVKALIESSDEPDYIIIENVNDRWYAADWSTGATEPTGSIADDSFMLAERVVYSNSYTTEAQAQQGFIDNFSTIIALSTEKKHGVVVFVEYTVNSALLTVTGTATSNGSIVITIGSNSYTVTVNNGMTASEIANAIGTYSFTGYRNVVQNNTVKIIPESGQTLEEISYTTTATGVSIEKTTTSQNSAVPYFFEGYTLSDYNNIQNWTSTQPNLYKCYKGIIEALQTRFPTSRIVWFSPMAWGSFDYNNPDASQINADGTPNMYKIINSSYRNYYFKDFKWLRHIVEEVCEMYGCQHINCDKIGGISPFNISTYAASGNIHPRQNAYQRFAEVLYRTII